MKQSKTIYQSLGLLAALALPMLASLAGCGSKDAEVPNDPAYYKGEMKGKGGQSGTAAQAVD